MTKSPTLKEFLECAQQEYRFLVDEFGFSESCQSANPFEVDYRSSRLQVAVEGINWGFAVQILLTPIQSGSVQPLDEVPLWAIARLRCPDELEQVFHVSEQLAQLRSYAWILRTHAGDVLRGDFTILAAARSVVVDERARSREPKKPHLP